MIAAPIGLAAPAQRTEIELAREDHRIACEVHQQRQEADLASASEIDRLEARKAADQAKVQALQAQMTEAMLAHGEVGDRPRQAADLEAEINGIDRALTIARHRREEFKVHLHQAGIVAANAETRLFRAEYINAAEEWGAHLTAGMPIFDRLERFARLSGTSIHVGHGWHIDRRVPKIGNLTIGEAS